MHGGLSPTHGQAVGSLCHSEPRRRARSGVSKGREANHRNMKVQIFAGTPRDNGTQRELWSPSPSPIFFVDISGDSVHPRPGPLNSFRRLRGRLKKKALPESFVS